MASDGRWPASGRPRKTIEPASGAIMPNSTFISVLLPEPFSPRRPRISPCVQIEIDAVVGPHGAEATNDSAHFQERAWHRTTFVNRARTEVARRRRHASTAAARVVLGRRDLQRARS